MTKNIFLVTFINGDNKKNVMPSNDNCLCNHKYNCTKKGKKSIHQNALSIRLSVNTI